MSYDRLTRAAKIFAEEWDEAGNRPSADLIEGAFRRGAEAMREAAAKCIEGYITTGGGIDASSGNHLLRHIAKSIRALPGAAGGVG